VKVKRVRLEVLTKSPLMPRDPVLDARSRVIQRRTDNVSGLELVGSCYVSSRDAFVQVDAQRIGVPC
jgi:hypothetical protein